MNLVISYLAKSLKAVEKKEKPPVYFCLYFKSIFMGAKHKCSKFYEFLKIHPVKFYFEIQN